MIFKVFPKGRCNLSYCLGIGRAEDPRHPVVLAGDPKQTQQIVNGLTFANPFTSLALTYDRQLSPDEIRRDIAGFEKTLLPGLDSTAWARVWIQHTEHQKDPLTKEIIPGGRVRTALHCIIANVHLPDGKRLQPYFDRIDRKRMEAWQEITNHKHGHASPKDPGRRRAFYIGSRLPKTAAELKATLNETVVGAIAAGEITSRENLCEWFRAQGFEVARATSKSISLKHPALKKNIRLEGAIYAHEGINRTIEGITSNPHPKHGVRDADLARYRRNLKEGLERKREELCRKYQKRTCRNHAEHGGTIREASPGGAMDIIRGGRIDFSKPGGSLASVSRGPDPAETAAASLSPRHRDTDGDGRAGGTGHGNLPDAGSGPSETGCGAASSSRRDNLLRSGTDDQFLSHEHHEPKPPQPDADGSRAFEFLAGLRSRTRETLGRIGSIVAQIADGLRTGSHRPRDDGDEIPNLGLGGAAVAALGRLLAQGISRRRRIAGKHAELFRIHDDLANLAKQREHERKRPGPMPAF
jgi:hypothetical protein